MKHLIFSAILLTLIAGCVTEKSGKTNTNSAVSDTSALILNERDLQALGLSNDLKEQTIAQFGLSGGSNCRTEEGYSNIVDSSQSQYSVCAYNIPALNDTEVVIELQRFKDYEALNGTYQYNSMHLFSSEGLISENEYGDQSRFRVNSEKDYGGQYNEPGVYYYHLWICKDLYLIHITSSGRSEEAKDFVVKIGQGILAKFG